MFPFLRTVWRRLRRRVDRYRTSRLPELEVREAYACLADVYPPEAHNPFMRLEQAAVLDLVPDVAGKAVLDVACGTGRYLKILRGRAAACVVGVDLSIEMLRRTCAPGSVARGDLRALPVAGERFELVTCGLAVGHVVELDAAIAEMARVLVPGGTLVYSDFHPSAFQQGRARVFRVGDRAFAVEHHPHLPEAHRAACRAAGLEIEEMRDVFSETGPRFPAVLTVRARRRP